MIRPQSVVPLLDWLLGYRKEWLRYDVIAGLITAAVVIPKAMAYATIAGLPVQVGLYTAFMPMVIYAVLGTSRPLEREYHHNVGHPGGGPTRPGRSGRRSGSPR